MSKPATLKVDVISDSRQARADLDSFSSKVAGFTAGITSAVTGFAIDKLTDAATYASRQLLDGVDKAASLSAALGTLNYNYGEASQTIARFAEGAASTLGLSKLAAIEAANRFSVYAKAIKLTGTEASSFATGLTKLAGDLGAFADLPTEDAINAIGSAFRGERDPIEKYGILLNDASVKAAYFRRTGEEVTGTLTTQQNILGTLQVLQEKGIEIGDAYAREQDQLGNKTKNASAEFENLKAKVGEFLIPAFTAVTDLLSTSVLPTLEGFVEAFRRGGFSGLFEEVAKKWEQAVPTINAFIAALPDRVTGFLNENLPNFEKWTAAASKWITDAILGNGTEENPGLLVRMQQLGRGIQDAAGQNKDGFRAAGSQIGGYVAEGLVNTITSYFSDSIRNYFTVENLKTIVFSGGNPFNFVGRLIAEAFWGGLKDGLAGAWNWMYDQIENLYNRIWALATRGFPDWLSGIGRGLSGQSVAVETPIGGMGDTYFTATINVYGPPGAEGGDIASWIVKELQDFVARNGKPAGLWA